MKTKSEINAFAAPFKYDNESAIDLCLKYSEDPDTLLSLIDRIKVEVTGGTVIPSPWNNDGRKLESLQFYVTVCGYSFPYYGSHNDAQAWKAETDYRKIAKQAKERKSVKNGLLYSVLTCIACDLDLVYSEPEDIGFTPDSIKDMAKWNECKEHARKLQSALKLTNKERDALPR